MPELADVVLATEQKMDTLIEESSLGTAGARQLRKRVSRETADKVVADAEAAPAPDDSLTRPGASEVRPLFSNATDIVARLKNAAFPELVKSSMAGDQEAIATLFAWIQPLVVRYCRSRIGRSGSAYSSADDVAQEICLAAHDALSRYGDEPESFLAFVYGIAAHKVADHYRRTGRDRSDPAADVPDGVDPDPDPEQQIMVADLRDRLNVLLSTLPPKHQELLRLRLIVGLSAQETGAILGLAPTAVRVIQHRAIAKLRNTLTHAEWH